MAGTIALATTMTACNGNGKDDSLPALDLGMQAQIGRAFVAQRGCPTCHQSSNAADGILSGQTTPAAGTMVYAANLTPDVATGLGGWADIEIVRAMRFGLANDETELCPPMPRFDGSDATQPFMTDVEAAAIVAYLRALPPVSRAIPASTCTHD